MAQDDYAIADQLAEKMSIGEAMGHLRAIRDQHVAALKLSRALQTVLDADTILENLKTQTAEWETTLTGLQEEHDRRRAALQADHDTLAAALQTKLDQATTAYTTQLQTYTARIQQAATDVERAEARSAQAKADAHALEQANAQALADAETRRKAAEAAALAAETKTADLLVALQTLMRPRG